MRAASSTRAPWTIALADGPRAPWLDRTVAAAFAIVAGIITCVLLRVTPDARGHGTHEQLGFDACSWPSIHGLPCPTCGCTTAACYVVHGRFVAAFLTQPFGATITVAGLLLGVHALFCLVRGRSFLDLFVRLPFWNFVAGGCLLLLLAWGYKCLMWPAP